MIAPVVVAVDGTPDGRRAIRYAIGLATMRGAPLRLVHVRHDNVMVSPMDPLFPERALDDIAAQVLRDAVADVRRMGWTGHEPEAVLAQAPRVAAILDHSADARCVVVGRRSSVAAHLLTGSTSNGLAAHCSVPMVCVPEAWNPEVRFNQVAVGVDCSRTSVPLIEAAAVLAHELGARVVVVHAWRPHHQVDAVISGRTYEGRWDRETRPLVERFVDPVRRRHPDVKIDVECATTARSWRCTR